MLHHLGEGTVQVAGAVQVQVQMRLELSSHLQPSSKCRQVQWPEQLRSTYGGRKVCADVADLVFGGSNEANDLPKKFIWV